MTHALALQHGDWGPPAILADWAASRGIELRVAHVDRGGALPELDGQAFVASLGSKYSPLDTDVRDVVTEVDYLANAIGREIPILGLCYGGQMLAHVLGGGIDTAAEPELGWHGVETDDPAIVPAGPWLQWHYQRFTVPPGAHEIARSPVGPQAFTHGRHLGVQFHPESTIEIVQEWARLDAERVAGLGIEDGSALVESGRAHAEGARASAYALFDAFWARARS